MPNSRNLLGRSVLLILLLSWAGCRKEQPAAAAQPTTGPVSKITVDVRPGANSGGGIVITTPAAEFHLLPSGYLQGFLLKDGQRLSLDDPAPNSAGATLIANGKNLGDFTYDVDHPSVTEAKGKLGPTGKRVEVRVTSKSADLDKTLAIEVYDDFPQLAVVSESYKNTGQNDVTLAKVTLQQHRFNAALAGGKAQPYQLWSFQGASYDWGKDDVLPISASFSHPNLMGAPVNHGHGGGIPVVAFWNASVGEAIGHIETLPLVLSIPVATGRDKRVDTGIALDATTTLKPNESFSTPRTFLAVYHGDYYEPLRMYSLALQKEGWTLPKPGEEAYNIAWCGWGYEFNVIPKQMLGTIPKLKEMGIKWATLDDRWFDTYGDWRPRKDTFPDDSIKKMVDEFHRQGVFAQLWWYPLVVEDGVGKYESHKYVVADVVKQHPDWLILDKDGKPARSFRGLATLCPALPEVQQYHKQLTEHFIKDWGFDGHKLDNIYTVAACYNPKHHHKSPQDSINAMGKVYDIIYQTTRALKPESVTQICPCGTTPNLAWLPYMDQAVTADPVGAVQVRRRIKMYKALLGPESAVYGDHVELTSITQGPRGERDLGEDFASTIGTGGVVGTKFTWPDQGPRFRDVNLTSEKEAHWTKWTGIYNSKMLSKGDFKDLYVIGYDVPEGYAIAKDGKMYYAFFAPDSKTWSGDVELRGLSPGKYKVYDYANDKDLGTVDAASPRLHTEFKDHLLLEISKQ